MPQRELSCCLTGARMPAPALPRAPHTPCSREPGERLLQVLLVSHPSVGRGLTSLKWRAAVDAGWPTIQLLLVASPQHKGRGAGSCLLQPLLLQDPAATIRAGTGMCLRPILWTGTVKGSYSPPLTCSLFPISFLLYVRFILIFKRKQSFTYLRQLALPSGLYSTSSPIVLPRANF